MQNEGVEHSFAASNVPFLLTMLCKVFVCQIWWFIWLENNNQILHGCLSENGKWLNGFSVPHSLSPDLRESESKHKHWVCSRYASHPQTAFISKSGRATSGGWNLPDLGSCRLRCSRMGFASEDSSSLHLLLGTDVCKNFFFLFGHTSWYVGS